MTNSRPRVRIALVLPASLAQHLTPLQRSAYVIADNKLALRAGLLRRPSMRASPSGTSPLRTSIISRPGQRFPSVIARGDRGGGQRYLSIHRHSGHPPLGGGHSADAPATSRARLLAGTNTLGCGGHSRLSGVLERNAPNLLAHYFYLWEPTEYGKPLK